ncbi:MAG: aldehyde dehydrogenase family protein [Pseudomonadota bacterium]
MTVKENFDSMDYGPAPESRGEAMAWLEGHKHKFGQFIDGSFTKPARTFESRNPATGELLAKISQASKKDVETAVQAARKAQPKWAKLTGFDRARYIYALARALQKHSRLFAVLETLDNGKPIRESRDIDIPLAQRHFYYHAGAAQLMQTELPDRTPLGVCGQIIPWNFPLLMLSWKIAPALAMGNTVVLKPAEYTSLTALLFAEICAQVGLPAGVVNIVTGDGAVGEMIVEAEVDKIAFTGSTAVGRKIRQATAGSGKSLTLELGGKSPYIVFDDADLDSAVEGLVDAIWFNQGQVCCAGSRLLVQEGVAEAFYGKLKRRMDRLRIGDPLDKCIDIGAIVDPVQLDTITQLVKGNPEGTHYVADTPLPEGCFYPPTLITGLSPSAALMQEEIFGPVLVATTFRTPAEALQVANQTRYGLAASVWTENINLALEIAPKLVAGVVWVNGTNMFDAAAGFGGVRESGYGREGGWEGLAAYTRPKTLPSAVKPAVAHQGSGPLSDPIDRTAKLYIGGKQARPDSGYSQVIYGPKGQAIGEVGLANRKDIRNAVEAAISAKSWSASTGHLRAQILYYIAENLSARADEFAARIKAMTGKPGSSDVTSALETLFSAAAWADKYDGQVHNVPMRGVALAMKEPVGVIGALCDDRPLGGLVEVFAPALAMGNRVIACASTAYPLLATDFYQVLETSDVPGGVVNILTGSQAELAPHLAAHNDIDAVWSFSSTASAKEIEAASVGNLKRTYVAPRPGSSKDMLAHATEVKNIWVPYGE